MGAQACVWESSVHPTENLMFIRLPEVCRRTGLSASSIRRLERRNVFPRRYRIAANAVAWLASDVDEWARQQIAVRHRAAVENETFLRARDVRRQYVLPVPTLKHWVAEKLLTPVLVKGEPRYSTRDIERLLGITAATALMENADAF